MSSECSSRNLGRRPWPILFLASAISASATGAALLQADALENSQDLRSSNMSHTASRSRYVLGIFKANPSGDLSYELSIAPCADNECPFQVRLLEGTKAWATVDLDWAKARGAVTKEGVDESSGVGDPLQPETQQTAWSTGEEKENVSTVARTVRLTPELQGLLVDQRAGFDHLKRHHYLFVAVDKKLTRAWNQGEGAGPTWSAVEIIDSTRNGPQRIVYFNGFRYPSDDQPDWMDLSVYGWNYAENQLQLAPERSSVFAVLAGTYPTVARAREVQTNNACLREFWVLKSEAFSGLTPGKVVLAAISYNGRAATSMSKLVKSCVPHLEVSVMRSSYGRAEK